MSTGPLKILGMPGSPYSRKLRAVLRYRRIPYAWTHVGAPESEGLPSPRVSLLPQLFLPNASGALEAVTDSTPLIRRLEKEHAGRSVVPADPALAFLDALLEDYGDEWLTKAMFHYRWAFAPDIAKASAVLPLWSRTTVPDEQVRAAGAHFAKRQIERLWVVGSNKTTGPVIEASYRRLLSLLDARVTESRFLLGGRPGASDFAVFGQLTQLVLFEPTSAALALETAPRVIAWTEFVEDLSGLEPVESDWISAAAVPETLRALFAEVGRVYVPFLLANADALKRGADKVECTIDGRRWTQKPFPYQGKCLEWLRRDHAALPADARRTVAEVLSDTGCAALFA